MINYQEKAASDDAAEAAAKATCKTSTAKPQTQLTRMVELFCANFARNLPTTEKDLWMAEFSEDEIRDHLPEARRLAAERTGIAA
ncbi:MAG: hypothetical protein GY927_11530 [bacterium]|nr:hypothetical protein [bacterium]